MSLPDIQIHGNLVADPELRFLPSGVPVAQFKVASTERRLNRTTNEWEDGDQCFLSVEVWRQQAENVAESLRKGTAVVVIGKLRQRSFETREGEKRTTFEVKDAMVSVDLGRQAVTVERNARVSTPAAASPPQAQAPAVAAVAAPGGTVPGLLNGSPLF